MRGKDQPWEKEVMEWARAEVPQLCSDLADNPGGIGEELHKRFDAWWALRSPRLHPPPDDAPDDAHDGDGDQQPEQPDRDETPNRRPRRQRRRTE